MVTMKVVIMMMMKTMMMTITIIVIIIMAMMVRIMSDAPMYLSTLRTSDAGVLTPPLRSGVLLVPMRCNPVCSGWEKGREKGRKGVSEKVQNGKK